jgi:predicted Rossmann fold flavoprotein
LDTCDVLIIGAGAAGMMCAIEAGKRGRSVRLIDHAKAPGEKIRISGGGRCNFTNSRLSPEAYLSANPRFALSALRRYTAKDFIALVDRYQIPWHEKTLGQLFCDDSARDIIEMLLTEIEAAGVELRLNCPVARIDTRGEGFVVQLAGGEAIGCASLVIATGGKSIPKMGATGFGYEIACQFGANVIPTRAALVPLTFDNELLEFCKALSGLSVEASVSCGKASFSEGLLFTHRGLSGPSILQISSYWQEGQSIEINLAPKKNAFEFLKDQKRIAPKTEIQNILGEILPKRLAQSLCDLQGIAGRIADLPNASLEKLAKTVNNWQILPAGTEGYRTAEVTLGGVDTNDLSSKTMEAKSQKGLYFIGEVVDVTGHLGGFNFQWAWSSGYVAGQSV